VTQEKLVFLRVENDPGTVAGGQEDVFGVQAVGKALICQEI